MRADGLLNSPIMIIGDAPSKWDCDKGLPFQGHAGRELNELLESQGLHRGSCYLTNVIDVEGHSKSLDGHFRADRKTSPQPTWKWDARLKGWTSPYLAKRCDQILAEVNALRPKVIVVVGDLPLRLLSEGDKIGKWRGSVLSGPNSIPVIPTWDPAGFFAQYQKKFFARRDWERVGDCLRDGAPLCHNYRLVIAASLPDTLRVLEGLRLRLEQGFLHISCDIETRGGMMDCIGLGWSKSDAICIPFMKTNLAEPNYWSSPEAEVLVIQALAKILTHPNAAISGQNFAYDAQYIVKEWGIIPRLAFDTLLAQHVCFPGLPKGLDVLSSLYCEQHRYWKDDGKEWNRKAIPNEHDHWKYNAEDCCRTYEIAEVLCRVVLDLKQADQCVELHKMWSRAVETMVHGVLGDEERRSDLSDELENWRLDRENWLAEVCGHALNVRSNKAMCAFFYDDLQLKTVNKRRADGTVSPSVDDASLIKLASREPLVAPIATKIREIRSLGVYRSTFVEAKKGADGRYRSYYNVAGAETFRFSSSKDAFGLGLNLQNVPSGGDSSDDNFDSDLELPNVRNLFLPDQDCEICDVDLSSADLRVVTAESRCSAMQELLDADLSPYVEVAKEYYSDASFNKKHPRYRDFKSLCHGSNYLGSAAGLADRIGLSTRDVAAAQDWYFGKFPEIRKWQNDVIGGMRSTRTVRNCFGYRRIYFDRIEGTIFNQAVAWIPQSTIGILINRIWDAVRTAAPWIRVLLQVHDSLVFCYPIARREEAQAIIQREARIRLPYSHADIYIPIGWKTSIHSWGDCE